MKSQVPTKHLYVAIDQSIVAEILRRGGPDAPIEAFIENLLLSFLDDTDGDAQIWSNQEYLDAFWEKHDRKDDKGSLNPFGPPNQGYRWGPVFLPNGTAIQMKYKGEIYHAIVQFGQVFTLASLFDLPITDSMREFYDDKSPYTPSSLANKIAGTNRNAWRDLWIKRPGESRFVLADDLRRLERNLR